VTAAHKFPGEALAFYPSFLKDAVGPSVIDGSYVVVDVGSGEALGQIGTIGSPRSATVEIGYGMNAAVHGRGIATAATGAIVTLLASNGSVNTVTARTLATNPASGRVLEKNGFSVIGRKTSDEGDLLIWSLAAAHPSPRIGVARHAQAVTMARRVEGGQSSINAATAASDTPRRVR
jgi:[ribosomal protein S5]-alanine N-acetyltransferase